MWASIHRCRATGGGKPERQQPQTAMRDQQAACVHRADGEAAAQHSSECGTSQVEEAPACSTQGAAAACDAMPRATVAFDDEDIRAARHSFAGLSAARGRCWANPFVERQRRCVDAASQKAWITDFMAGENALARAWRSWLSTRGSAGHAGACRAAVAEPSRVRSSGLATPPQKQSPPAPAGDLPQQRRRHTACPCPCVKITGDA